MGPGYFRAMGIRLLRGRDFNEHDTSSSLSVAIVSRTVAKAIDPSEDVIGHRVRLWTSAARPEAWQTIVGVVDDVKQMGPSQESHPAIYQPYPQVSQRSFLSHMTYVVRTKSDPLAAVPAIRTVLRAVDKDQPATAIGLLCGFARSSDGGASVLCEAARRIRRAGRYAGARRHVRRDCLRRRATQSRNRAPNGAGRPWRLGRLAGHSSHADARHGRRGHRDQCAHGWPRVCWRRSCSRSRRRIRRPSRPWRRRYSSPHCSPASSRRAARHASTPWSRCGTNESSCFSRGEPAAATLYPQARRLASLSELHATLCQAVASDVRDRKIAEHPTRLRCFDRTQLVPQSTDAISRRRDLVHLRAVDF